VRQGPAQFAAAGAQLRAAVTALGAQGEAELADPALHPARRKVLESLGDHWTGLTVFVEHPDVPMGRVERWRGGLGQAQLLPALSSAGASLARPCPVSTSRSSNRTCRFPASGSHPDPPAFAFGRAARRSGTGKRPRSSYR
jgi:hypothetical protein